MDQFAHLFVLTSKSGRCEFLRQMPLNKGWYLGRKDVTNYLEHLKIEPKTEFYEPLFSFSIISAECFEILGQSFEKHGEIDKQEEILLI